MAVEQIAALVIDTSSGGAQEFLRALQPEIQFAASDYTSSLRKAAVSHSEDDFQICFLSEEFSEHDLASFFKDMSQLEKAKSCLFVQVREELPADFDRSSLSSIGFTTVVTRKGTHEDKTVLRTALDTRFHVQEVKRRKVNVDRAMEKLLKEIDRAATDHRRGVHYKMAAIRMDGIELDVQFDPAVLDGYFSTLATQTEVAVPRTIERLEIPEKVLRKALPGLTKEGYQGKSHRVWEYLAKRYGVKAEDIEKTNSSDQNPSPSDTPLTTKTKEE